MILVDTGFLVSAFEPREKHHRAQAHERIASLAEKYHDQDAACVSYADLALIWLAENSGHARILTLDRRDFSVYRTQGRKRFELPGWTG